MLVKNIITKRLVGVDYQVSVYDAVQIMDNNHIGSVVIRKNGKDVGIFTERDLLSKVIAKGKDYKTEKVGNSMTSPIITINIEANLQEASDIMMKKKIRRLIVEKEGKFIGIITQRDITQRLKYSLASKLSTHKHFHHYKPSYRA